MHVENMGQREVGAISAEPIGLGTQVRVAVGVLAVVSISLFAKGDNSPERQDPAWRRLRQREIEAEEAYSNTPKDDPGRHEAHMKAQDAWRERDTYEAEHFDPQD